MSTHEPQAQDVKWSLDFRPGHSRTLRRIPCSCGWRGCWFGMEGDFAEQSFARHAELSTPLRDCGHAFTHVGHCVFCPTDPLEAL